MNSTLLQSLNIYCVQREALPTHDLHREHPHPTSLRLVSVSLATNKFDEQCEDYFGFRLELREELLEQDEDNMGAVERKRGSGAWRAC
jgi:hypothetical protein